MRTRSVSLLVVCLAGALAGACGSSTTGPSAPPIPNYAGNWSGTYTITGCTQNGGVALANICGSLGNTPPYSFSFTQNGNSVTGSFTLGSINFPSTGGIVLADGSLGLSATTITSGTTIIVTWALHNSGSAVTGTITQVWTNTTLSGQANVAGIIASANHTLGARSFHAATDQPRTLAELAVAAGRE